MPKIESITKFDVGKKLSQPSEYAAWRMRAMAGLAMLRLEQLVQGNERYDDRMLKNCYDVRSRKAQGLHVSSISDEVLLRYEDVVFKADPMLLWDRIYRDFGRGPGVNTDMVLADLYARKLQPDETAEQYINNLLRMQRILAENNDPIADHRVARLMLTNAMRVYPKITDDVTRRGIQATDFTIYDSRAELVNAEMTARAREQHNRSPRGGRGLSSGRPQQANFVQRCGRGKSKKPRQRDGRDGGNRSRSVSSASSTASAKAASIAKRKQTSRCSACGEMGHWKDDRLCKNSSQQAAGNSEQGEARMQSFAGGVFLRPETSDSREDSRGFALQSVPAAAGYAFDEVREVLGERAAAQLREELETKRPVPENEPCVQNSPTTTQHRSPPSSPTGSRGGLVAMVLSQEEEKFRDVVAEEMEWLLDSGSQVNLCGDLSCFSYIQHGNSGELCMALGQTETLNASGSVVLRVMNEVSGKWEPRRLDEVHYSPNAHVNLIRLGYMQACGFAVSFSDDQCVAWLTKRSIKLRFDRYDKLYRLRTKRSIRLVAAVETRKNAMGLLHNRLGHVNMQMIHEMAANKVDFGINVNLRSLSADDCVPCLSAKFKRMSYKRNPERRSNPLEKLSVDLCSISQEMVTGETMFMLVVDEATRFKWCYLLKRKNEAADKLKKLILRLNTQFLRVGHKVVTLHSDQGGEFQTMIFRHSVRKKASRRCTLMRILLENSVVERANGLVLPRLRAVLHATHQTNLLWGEALLHVVDTANTLPTAALNGTSPHEALHKKKPVLRHLRTWGCLVHAHVPTERTTTRDKLDPRAELALLIGYSTDTKGLKLLDLRQSTVLPQPALGGSEPDLVVRYEQVGEQEKDAQQSSESTSQVKTSCSNKPKDKRKRRLRSDAETLGDDYEPPKTVPEIMPCRDTASCRARKPPVHLREYIVGSVLNTKEDIPVPNTYKQAKKSQYWTEWQAAMQEELTSLRQHGTWKLVARAKANHQAVITNKWVYTLKRDAEGRIKRFKARLVIHGFKQHFGIDYLETYAPVIRFEAIWAAILYARKRGWDIKQYDVKTVFLYGLPEELTFMEIPARSDEGVSGGTLICQLIKSLYGLKQAPAVWNKTLHAFLVSLRLTRLDSDYGLYAMYKNGEVAMLLTVYVDDLLLMGPAALCSQVAAQLESKFTLTSMGEVRYLLGIEITLDGVHNRIVYSQRSHIDKLLKKFNLENSYGCWTPQATSEFRAKPKPFPKDAAVPYRELVGGLQYLVSGSRPDIAHAVQHLGKFLSCYTEAHYREAERVQRYLHQTRDYALHMNVIPGKDVDISVFTDSDYANDPDDAKSISGYVTFLDGNVISYGSRKQGINAQSSTEAEYVAMNEGVKDILWIVGLCEELKWPAVTPLLRGDNQAALCLAEKPG
ncbi:hypothetical protein PC110_g17962 [Phytophthora cactorum]|uniref:Integrase catalytic domain-containing protein n=1 Tax=Phytophthora cactorum TaxID=29920 RepID=A0A329RLH9_9STRA|nr:hypothetical protein PC110_g17962 [Phytophthora cactorum]